MLRGGLLAAAGAVGGGLAGGFSGHKTSAAPDTKNQTEPFPDAHQAGIVTNTQRQAVLAAFDLAALLA